MTYSNYLGIPFKINGRTLKELDCYGLVMLLYKDIHNVTIPDVISPQFISEMHDLISQEKLKWTPCDLEVGAVIVFNIKGYGSHVGYYIGQDKFIHTWQGTGGVVIERLSLSWKHRILGTYKWNN